MISRAEFYICFLLIGAMLGYLIWGGNSSTSAERARIEMRDSVLTAQRDSALAHADKKDMRSDSLQSVINRQTIDLQKTHEKYIYIKEAVVRLSADSSLAWFLRAIN